MRHLFTITTLFILTFSSMLSQEATISGIVMDENNHPLPYVNIGFPNKSIGTVSTIDGTFILKLPSEIHEKDTVRFSYIGYESKSLTLSEFSKNSNFKIELQPTENLLGEVVLKSKKLKNKKLGRTNKGLGLMHWNFYSAREKDVNDRLSKELGMNFKIRQDCLLEQFNFAISSNQFKSLKFRINIYEIVGDLPGQIIISENIIFELKDGILGWQAIDLTPYNVYLNQDVDEVLITLQWLESEKQTEDSKYFAIPASKSPFHKTYYRDKAMDDWKVRTGSLSMYIDAKCS